MVKDYQPYSLGSMVRKTEAVEPIDKACLGQVSKSAGRNEGKPRDSLVRAKDHLGETLSG